MNRWYFAAALEMVLLVGRHGVRSPLQTPKENAPYAAEPWPHWPVAPGVLTTRGGQMSQEVGHYFRERLIAAGLLTGNPEQDASAILLRSDSDQRTMESARREGEGLAPGQTLAFVARPNAAADPLFGPYKLHLGNPDINLAMAAVLGRMGGDPRLVFEAHRAAFTDLQRALFGDDPPAWDKQPVLSMLGGPRPGTGVDLITMTGAFRLGLTMTDSLLLEYADGMPNVGWGRVGASQLQEFMALHALYFNLTQKTFYCAQVQGSNLALHILETLEQAAQGRPVAGAIGPVGKKVVVVLGHDTNLINLAGLMNLSWIIPGTQADPVIPSSQLAFELLRGDDGQHWVRIEYVAPTLEQQRRGDQLSLQHPPAAVPIFIPDCSTAAPAFDAPLTAVEAKLRSVIALRYTVPGSE